jgi:ABC-2 type transport system permease protein
MGTSVEPSQIGLMFSVVLTPMLFTGCIYFPWAMLGNLRWFQVITCINPITYSSEGFRASLVPALPHMPVWFILVGQLVFLMLFGYFGIRGFLRKAID